MNAGNKTRRGLTGVSVIALALVAAGCGSDQGTGGDVRLEPAVAERLAAASEAVASSLDSGDTCGAARAADDLAAEVSAAEMPERLRAEAEGAAAELVNTVNCEPEPARERDEEGEENEDGEEGREEGEGRGEERGEGGGSSGPGPGPPGHGGRPPGLEGKELSGGGFD